jgi:hypothetical protein
MGSLEEGGDGGAVDFGDSLHPISPLVFNEQYCSFISSV